MLFKSLNVPLIGTRNCIKTFSHQATNEVISRVPEATQDEMQSAVRAAKEAFPLWSQTTILTRQQIMFKLQQLIKDNMVIVITC